MSEVSEPYSFWQMWVEEMIRIFFFFSVNLEQALAPYKTFCMFCWEINDIFFVSVSIQMFKYLYLFVCLSNAGLKKKSKITAVRIEKTRLTFVQS